MNTNINIAEIKIVIFFVFVFVFVCLFFPPGGVLVENHIFPHPPNADLF